MTTAAANAAVAPVAFYSFCGAPACLTNPSHHCVFARPRSTFSSSRIVPVVDLQQPPLRGVEEIVEKYTGSDKVQLASP